MNRFIPRAIINFFSYQFQGPQRLTKSVDCGPYIAEGDINQLLGEISPLDDKDRRLLQKARSLILEESRWVWKHGEIHIKGHYIDITLYAGDRVNKYVVTLDDEDRIKCYTTDKGWRLKFRDGAVSVWNFFKGAVKTVAGAIGGGATKAAIGWLPGWLG